MTPDELMAIADGLVSRAAAGEDMEVVASWSHDTEVRAYDGNVEHLVSSDSAGVGVRVLVDGRQGTAWTGAIDQASLADCVAEARDNVRFAGADVNAGLAEPDGLAIEPLELFDDRLAGESIESKIEMAIELERQVMASDRRIVGIESSDYADSTSAVAIASTRGVRASGAETTTYLGTYVLAGEGDQTTTGFGFSVGRSGADLRVTDAATDAVARAVAQLGAKKAPSGRVKVVFDPYVTSQFVSLVADMLAGDAVVRGRSPFAERVGEEMAASLVTLYDDPTNPVAPTASEVDGEGLACRRVPLIDGGRLSGFMHNSYTARCMGATSTGSAQRSSLQSPPAVGAFVATLAPGDIDPAGILGAVGDGLMVTELAGLHSGVNIVSGDLSVGIEGRMIRGGELAEAVAEVTIASTIQRMLSDITHIGSDMTYFPWESTGVTLAIADMAMSGL